MAFSNAISSATGRVRTLLISISSSFPLFCYFWIQAFPLKQTVLQIVPPAVLPVPVMHKFQFPTLASFHEDIGPPSVLISPSQLLPCYPTSGPIVFPKLLAPWRVSDLVYLLSCLPWTVS